MHAALRQASIFVSIVVMLVSCSPAVLMEKLPTAVGGLPADAPAAPTAPAKYPAVHDMPPPRPDTPLTEEQQVKLEKDLKAARDKLEEQAQDDPAQGDQGDTTQGKKKAKTGK